MKHMKVTYHEARKAVRASHGLHFFREIWGYVQRGEAILLLGGAKLSRVTWPGKVEYHINGYAADGSDVDMWRTKK